MRGHIRWRGREGVHKGYGGRGGKEPGKRWMGGGGEEGSHLRGACIMRNCSLTYLGLCVSSGTLFLVCVYQQFHLFHFCLPSLLEPLPMGPTTGLPLHGHTTTWKVGICAHGRHALPSSEYCMVNQFPHPRTHTWAPSLHLTLSEETHLTFPCVTSST